MSARIKYAYLKGQTWLYRRNYPRDVALVLGSQALKQSLRTGDVKTARIRAADVNSRYEETVRKVLEGAQSAALAHPDAFQWAEPSRHPLAALRASLSSLEAVCFEAPKEQPAEPVKQAARRYLLKRQGELRHGGFKSVRYSVELFASKYGSFPLDRLGRDEGREFLTRISELSPLLGKSETTQRLSLDQAVRISAGHTGRITVRTQKRTWSQVNHFLDWCVYEGVLEQNPFRTVRFEQKVKHSPYSVMTDEEVKSLLAARDTRIHSVLLICLLTGMRAGEATGLRREDVLEKGNLGRFFHIRPNDLRLLKTDAAERLVPVHPVLDAALRELPSEGPLFPKLNVNLVTKGFAKLRGRTGVERPGLVFHSTRKWFITQCERTGVPEHFTASLVGHKSARSENGITYGIYSAGISDEQKRSIVDQIRLPT